MSIYNYILNHITNNQLPKDFSLPDNTPKGQLRFADGAKDGINIYHTSSSKISEDILSKIAQMFEMANEREFVQAKALVKEITKKCSALNIIDEIEGHIIEHKDELQPRNIYDFGYNLMTESNDAETVKVGLEILEVFSEPDEEQKQIIRTLGLSDEFTIFVLFHMMTWTNKNEEIFELAKRVHGWGRVHAVERLEPTSQEIKDWLLYEGIKNDVMPEYSALECYRKADVESRLNNTLTKEEYQAIGKIIDTLLSEGPVSGISAVEHSADMLLAYVNKEAEYLLNEEDYDTILGIKDYAAGNEDLKALSDRCQEILASPKCKETVIQAVKQGKAIHLAKNIGIDYYDDLLQCLKNDFNNFYHQCELLLCNKDYVEAVLDIFRKNLPLSSMATGPAECMGLGQEFKVYGQLIYLIQYFRKLPVCTGIDFIETAINAPVINNRSMALRVMKAWVVKEQKPLQEVSESLFQLLGKVYEKEVRDDLKSSMKALLDGEINFSENDL